LRQARATPPRWQSCESCESPLVLRPSASRPNGMVFQIGTEIRLFFCNRGNGMNCGRSRTELLSHGTCEFSSASSRPRSRGGGCESEAKSAANAKGKWEAVAAAAQRQKPRGGGGRLVKLPPPNHDPGNRGRCRRDGFAADRPGASDA